MEVYDDSDYINEILDDDAPTYVEIDYSKVTGEPLPDFDFGSFLTVKDKVKKEVKVPVLSFTISKEEKVEEKQLYLGFEEVTQFERNERKEQNMPYTILEKKISMVLEQDNISNIPVVYEELQNEWISNGAKSILTDWPHLECGGMSPDFDKVHLMTQYTGLSVSNKYLYEMYAYSLELEKKFGFKLIWSKFWKSFKYILAFKNYEYPRYYMRLLRQCDDKYFQQYINLVSLIYNWGLIFAYPYAEKFKKDKGMCRSQAIVMTPNLDPIGELLNEKEKISKIGLRRGDDIFEIEYDIMAWLPDCSAREMVSFALVCRSWYYRVSLYVEKFREYNIYLGKYAFGVGMTRICPIRRAHTINSPYAGTMFGERVAHENIDCDECLTSVDSNEMDMESCEIDTDRYIQGYNAILYVNCDMLEWLEVVMSTLPLRYREIYDKTFCVTPGHFACIYECVMETGWMADLIRKFVNFYDKDFLFHMILPFVPGALNWSWNYGTRFGKELRKYNAPD